MKNILIFIFLTINMMAFGQTPDSLSLFKISGYLETYYNYDFGQPDNHTRPGFVYAHNRHNEVNLNIGFVKVAYEKNNLRGNMALMAGTYANANLAAEPGTLRNVFEANVGVKLSKTKNLWLDAGVMPSHIGFESAIGKDCWTLTRSILADNSPYFESGARVSYTSPNGKWYVSGLLLNGWQRIQRVDGSQRVAFGHQLTWKPNAQLTLNSSSFIGSDKPDTLEQTRIFHNFYLIYSPSGALGITAGFDIGSEKAAKPADDTGVWYSPVCMVQWATGKKSSFTARLEYYADPDQVIVFTGTAHGFQTMGYSLNFDYRISDKAMWRLEGKGYSSRDEIFVSGNDISKTNFSVTTALTMAF